MDKFLFGFLAHGETGPYISVSRATWGQVLSDMLRGLVSGNLQRHGNPKVITSNFLSVNGISGVVCQCLLSPFGRNSAKGYGSRALTASSVRVVYDVVMVLATAGELKIRIQIKSYARAAYYSCEKQYQFSLNEQYLNLLCLKHSS